MEPLVVALDASVGVLRLALLVGVGAVALLAALSQLVRARRLNPFGSVARFVRRRVDPVFAPVEHRVMRHGVKPGYAGWWTLAAFVLAGILLISVLGFVRQQVVLVSLAARTGTGAFAGLIVSWTFGILRLALFARVIASWIRVSAASPWLRWAYLFTDWLIRPLQRVIPPFGMVDATPIVAYFILTLLEPLVRSLV